MSKNILKKIVLLAVTSIGLYFSGLNLITMLSRLATIKSFSEALTVMTFFTCLFPFLILSLSLLRRALKTLISLLKLTSQMIQTAIF
jgi:hypothetical protein